MAKVLQVKNLRTCFDTESGTVRAVDGVDLSLEEGETLGIAGESGCGKTVLALSIMRLIPSPPGRVASGQVMLDGVDITRLSDEEMRKIRGRGISMIFQEPMTSLNPVIPVGEQIAEAVRLHLGFSRKDAACKAVEMLKTVGIPSPSERVKDYPHQMSGGMRQRVMIAIALSCRPRLMLADEPTTALDVTIQAQILDLINRLKEEAKTSVVLITHDLGVIAEAAQKVAVMYAGLVVEYSSVRELYYEPRHPYTVGLLESRPGPREKDARDRHLKVIPGTVPNLYELPPGCPFHNRCNVVMDRCKMERPEYTEISEGHYVRCWRINPWK
ncbi:MAG TPA: ABC transporter ATP-binding protein [Syntrophales bacterium]|nr:ABC transporter ATP-binding protein [Syntrophales bacterium]